MVAAFCARQAESRIGRSQLMAGEGGRAAACREERSEEIPFGGRYCPVHGLRGGTIWLVCDVSGAGSGWISRNHASPRFASVWCMIPHQHICTMKIKICLRGRGGGVLNLWRSRMHARVGALSPPSLHSLSHPRTPTRGSFCMSFFLCVCVVLLACPFRGTV